MSDTKTIVECVAVFAANKIFFFAANKIWHLTNSSPSTKTTTKQILARRGSVQSLIDDWQDKILSFGILEEPSRDL